MEESKIIQNQVALFNLLCALFRRITGQTPTVRIWTQNGAILTEPSLDDVICDADNQEGIYVINRGSFAKYAKESDEN